MLKKMVCALVSAPVRRRVILLGVSLSFVLVLSLVACTGPASTPEPTPAPEPTSAPLPEPTSALIQVTDLVVSPVEVKLGEVVVITADLTNTGDTEDSYIIELTINDTTVLMSEVTVPAGETGKLRFLNREESKGIYVVSLGELSRHFAVVDPGESLLVVKPGSGTAVPEQSALGCCGGSAEPLRSGCGCTEHPELLQERQAGAPESDVPSCCG